MNMISRDISTYLLGANLKADFNKAFSRLQLLGNGNSQKYEKIEQALDTVMEVLRSLVKEKLQEKGLMDKMTMNKVPPTDWRQLYEKIIPESERREKVMLT